jgi:hypothetical protein
MNINEWAVDAFAFMLGASVFIWAKALASALNRWAARQYIRFPKLKMLPGARNAGTAMNYRLTFIWFRICGLFVCFVVVLFDLMEYLPRPHR